MTILMNQTGSDPALHQPDLEADVQRVLRDLKSACSGLIASLTTAGGGGRPIRRATDLQRALNIRPTVAWQLHRLANACDLLHEAEAVPGPIAIKRVIQAAQHRKVPSQRLEQLMAAVQEFDTLVQTHAGSRKTFNAMIAALGSEADDVLDLQTRRAAFHANSRTWGLHARACLWSTINFPGKSPEHMSVAAIRGPIDLKRLRVNAPYIVSSFLPFERSLEIATPQPLGAASDMDSPDPRLLLPFCTRPLPQVSSSLSDGEFIVTEMPAGPIGNEGTSTIVLADASLDSTWKRDDEKPHMVNSVGIATPVEVAVVDTLFHHSMFGRLTPRPRVFGRHSFPLGMKPHLYRETDILPVAVQAAHIGRGPWALESPDIPNYREMVEHVCAKLHLDPNDFDVYRCRVEYPILYAHVGVWFDLPDKGNW